MHMMLSLSMRNIKIFKVSLGISPKTHSYAYWLWTRYKDVHKTNETSFFFARSEGYFSVIYVEDCYLQDSSFKKFTENVIRKIEILESLGFYIKADKSEIIPKQQITLLGVIIDSLHIKKTLTIEKKQILNLCPAARVAHTLLLLENWPNSIEVL